MYFRRWVGLHCPERLVPSESVPAVESKCPGGGSCEHGVGTGKEGWRYIWALVQPLRCLGLSPPAGSFSSPRTPSIKLPSDQGLEPKPCFQHQKSVCAWRAQGRGHQGGISCTFLLLPRSRFFHREMLSAFRMAMIPGQNQAQSEDNAPGPRGFSSSLLLNL